MFRGKQASLKTTGTLVITLILITITAAHAQYVNPFTGTNWNNPVSSTIDTIIRGNQQMRMLMRPHEQHSDAHNVPSPAPAPLSATSFTPMPGSLLAQTFAESFSEDQEEQRELIELFEMGLSSFEAEARTAGKPNNVAMALTYFIVANYYIYTGGQEPSEAAQESLWATLHEGLATTPEFQATSNMERQELYETFMILASFPFFLYHLALEGGDDELASLSHAFAGQLLEATFGVQAQQVHFTETGLEITDITSDPPGGLPGDSPGGNVSAELVGEWTSGSVPPIDTYEPGGWEWGSPSSNGESFKFTSNGGYIQVYLEHVNLRNCFTGELIFVEGVASVEGLNLELMPTRGHYRYLATCATHMNKNRELTNSELDVLHNQLIWSIVLDRDDPSVRRLVLTSPDGSEVGTFTSRE